MPSQLHGATQDEAHIHISFTTGQNTSHLSQVCLIHCYITNKPSMYLSMQNNTCWYLIYIHCYITNKPSMYLSMQNNTCWYLIYIHCYITNHQCIYQRKTTRFGTLSIFTVTLKTKYRCINQCKTTHFGTLSTFHGPWPWELAYIVSDYEKDDLFYSVSPHSIREKMGGRGGSRMDQEGQNFNKNSRQ